MKQDEYPTTRSDAITILNKYNERKQPALAVTDGTAFAQKGKKGGAEKKKGNEKEEEKKPKKNFFVLYVGRKDMEQGNVLTRRRPTQMNPPCPAAAQAK